MRRPIQLCLAVTALGLIQNTAGASEGDPTILGAGAYTIPVYPGGRDVEVRPAPIVEVTYWNRLFLRSTLGAGVYFWHKPTLDVGISIDADRLHRYEADDSRLRGLGDVSQTARANLFFAQRCRWMEATVRLSTDIGGAGHGNTVDVELARSRHPTPQLSIRTGFGATWANTQNLRSFFGVDPQQSPRSGLPLFSPEHGFSTARLFVSATYEFRPHWLLGGQLYASRLVGDAADSPITQRRTSGGGGLFLAYRMR
jgi:outer membrane protein